MSSVEKALNIVRLTDVGQLRARNEDAVASDASIGLALLADGMGGYNAGDVASQMAALTITAELKTRLTDFEKSQIPIDAFNASNLIIEAVNVANTAIYQVSQEQAQCAGMGTTLVLCVFIDNQVVIGHIGDSRAYLLRNQMLSQLTNDHSLLQEQVDSGLLTAEQAKHATYKNFVTKALGVEPMVALEINTFDVQLGDCYLLCSDGLSDMLDDDEIRETLLEYPENIEFTAQSLIKKANLRGGKDNISVIIVEVRNTFPLKSPNWASTLLKKYIK